MHDVMMDIEALSTQLGAVVLTIGAVIFDPESDRIGQTFAIRLPVQEQIDKGALVNIDTMEWWIEQPLEARNAAFHGPCAHSVAVGLGKFSRFLQRIPGERLRLWSNGPAFDSAQLQLLYARFRVELGPGMGWPVRYNADRDCRTIFSLAYPQGGIPVEEKGVAHNALDDAIWQARTVQACMQKLRDRAHP